MSEYKTLANLNAEIIALSHQRDELKVEVAKLLRQRDELRSQTDNLVLGMKALQERLSVNIPNAQ
jgi:uncharacterized coiled-coil DUF342 family protein